MQPGKSQHSNNDPCEHLYLGESHPQVPALMPDNPVPPHICLHSPEPCLALELRGRGPCKFSLWCQPFKRSNWVASSLYVTEPQSTLVFTARSSYCLKVLLFPGLGLWAGHLVWGWDPLLLWAASQLKKWPTWLLDQPVTSLCVLSSLLL